MSLQIIRAGLDWLQVSYSGEVSEEVLDRLEQLKAIAQAKETPQPYPIGLFECFVLPRGRGWWAYVLKNPEFELMLAKSNGHGAVASLRLSAFGLANTEPSVLLDHITGWLPEIGTLKPLSVSRVDVAVDVQGLDPTPEMMGRIVCSASYRATHGTEKNVQTYQFGKGDVVLRVYDKTAEIVHSGKTWVEESWRFASGYDKTLPVHRIEVQLRRKALAELGIDHPAQVLANPEALLDYGLSWANLRVPSTDRTKTRWPEDPAWITVRSATFGGTPLQRVVRIPEIMSLDRVMSATLGQIATAAAYFETDDYLDALQRLSFAVEVHMMEDKTDFAALVEEKRRRILSKGV